MNDDELFSLLENPEFIGENRVPAHSDHFFYEKADDIHLGSDMPLKQSLNGVWKFRYSKNISERPKNFYEVKYDISKFDDIVVPGHIEMQGYDRRQYVNVNYPWDGIDAVKPPHISRDFCPVGSYVKDVKIDKNLSDKALFISFSGVETAFRLFINGKYAGYAEDSFTPSDFEITPFIVKGKNRIAVEVYKRASASWLEDQDMWRFFGIFREVYIYAVPSLHVEDMFIKALLDKDYDKGVLDVYAKTSGKVSEASIELFYLGKERAFEAPMSVSEGKLSLHMEGLPVKHWSAEEPNLYEARISLKDSEGAVKEIAVTNIGFRTFEIKNKVMMLNGKRIVFKGVDRHEFSSVNGRVVSSEEMLWDIKTFKKNNINAVRTSHYPDSAEWYRLCDEYGVYMISETNIESHGLWFDGMDPLTDSPVPGSKPEWKDASIDRANNNVQTNKNHPAVLLWSLGNEAYGGDNFVAMHDFIHEIDDTRLVHYEGAIHHRPTDRCSDVETRMYEKVEGIRDYLNNNPQKPFILCEYMHAMGNSLGGMKAYTDLEDEYEMYQGGFIWDYLDQALWQEHNGRMRLVYGGDFGDRPCDYGFSTDGIVFANRVESPKCPEAKNLYANVRLTANESEITVENRNLFIDLSRYYFLYTVSADGETVFAKSFFDIDLKPGEKGTYTIDADYAKDEKRDYVFRVKMCEKNATKWAPEGFMVAFSESVKFADENPVLVTEEKKTFWHVANGLYSYGANTQEFGVIFDKGKGLISVKLNDEEIVTLPPMPTYFRAYTDNDDGFNLGRKASYWHMLTLYQISKGVSIEEKENCLEATFEYVDPSSKETVSKVVYSVFPENRIQVSMKYFGKEGRPFLPLFGWEMKIDKQYDKVVYFGKGPCENYRDRDNGVYTDIFETTVSSNVTPYLNPQECGNRTGVRYAKITNESGHGMLIGALFGTFEFGFLPFSAYEMYNAKHMDELPERSYTWLRIMSAQMGVGGDDSWGAPVHKEFTLDSSKDMELGFEIKFI